MPYDAPDYKTIYWDERGSPYWMTAGGKKNYIPPITAAQYHDDPKMLAWAKSKGASIDYVKGEDGNMTVGPGGVTNTSVPGQGILHKGGTWNSEKGQYDTPFDFGNLMSMIVGGTMAAPLLAGALGGGAAAGATGAGGEAAAGGGAAAGAGTLASSTIAPLAGATPAGIASGTGMAAGGAGGASMAGGSILGKLTSPDALSSYADILGGMAKSGADQNNREANLKALMEQVRLNRDKFATDAPGTRLNTGIRASLMSNFKPTSVDWGEGGFHPGMGAEGKMPKFSGGMAGGLANLQPDAKQLSEQVMHDSLVSQMRGGASAGGGAGKEDGYGTDNQMPDDITGTSGLDKALGGAATGTSILAALRKAWGK